MDDKSDTLDMPPFPNLKWDDYFWAADTVLSAWTGFQSRRGPYGSIDETSTSDGTIGLTVATQDDEARTPSAEQAAAYKYLIENQEQIRDSLLQAFFNRYPAWQEQYGSYYEAEEFKNVMPKLKSPEQLSKVIGLSIVHIHTVARDGMAYVGYEFGCNWEEEHGLGAMTHAGRVVDVGDADTAILEWVAEEDLEKDD